MKRVILESPYAGKGPWPLNAIRRWRNVRYARLCMRDCIMRGEAPIASHLLYTQPGVLRDDDSIERAMGIDAGLSWGAVADVTVVYTGRGISSGMTQGIKRARLENRPVEYRVLGQRKAAPGAGSEPLASDQNGQAA